MTPETLQLTGFTLNKNLIVYKDVFQNKLIKTAPYGIYWIECIASLLISLLTKANDHFVREPVASNISQLLSLLHCSLLS